jgi:hypothetical protein
MSLLPPNEKRIIKPVPSQSAQKELSLSFTVRCTKQMMMKTTYKL